MKPSLEYSLAEVFREATMQNLVFELRNESDWNQFQTIHAASQKRQKTEREDYEENRSERLAKAREELLRQAGSKTLDHPAPIGADRFDKNELERRAMLKVENDHAARLLTIKKEETDAYARLKDDILGRDFVRDHARDAFTRAVDRRSGQERRITRTP